MSRRTEEVNREVGETVDSLEKILRRGQELNEIRIQVSGLLKPAYCSGSRGVVKGASGE